MQLDFSDELKVVADTWTWSRDPQTQVHFIRQCFRNGLWVEWERVANGRWLGAEDQEARMTAI